MNKPVMKAQKDIKTNTSAVSSINRTNSTALTLKKAPIKVTKTNLTFNVTTPEDSTPGSALLINLPKNFTAGS